MLAYVLFLRKRIHGTVHAATYKQITVQPGLRVCENIYSRRLLLSARSSNVPSARRFRRYRVFLANFPGNQVRTTTCALFHRASKESLHRSCLIETQHPVGYPPINLVSLSSIFTIAIVYCRVKRYQRMRCYSGEPIRIFVFNR